MFGNIGRVLHNPAVMAAISRSARSSPGLHAIPIEKAIAAIAHILTSNNPQGVAKAAAAILGDKGERAAGLDLGRTAGALQKCMFVAVLEDAIESANGKAHFNMETAINDLWTKVTNLRSPQSEAQVNLQNTMAAMSKMTQTLSNVQQRQHETAKGMIQNMR